MIFKKIGNMENVEAICHYFLILFSILSIEFIENSYLLAFE